MNRFFRQISVWIILLIVVLYLLSTFSQKGEPEKGLWSKHFEEQLRLGNIESVKIRKLPEGQYKFQAEFKEPVMGQNRMEFETDLYKEEWRELLTEQGISSDAKPENTLLTGLLINIFPIILIIGVFWFFMFRHMQGGSNNAMLFGGGRARHVGSDDKMLSSEDPAHLENSLMTFDEFEIGEEFPIPSRTVTEAHFSAFQSLSGDNHPIHYDAEYCKRIGHEGMLAHGFQVLAFSAAGAGHFPHVLGESLIGFIEQSCRFLKPVYPGDTLYPLLKVSDLKRQNTTGVITLHSTIHNQKRELVLEGEHKYLVKL